MLPLQWTCKMPDLKIIRKSASLSQIQLAQRASVYRLRISPADTESLGLRPPEVAVIGNAVRSEMQKATRIESLAIASNVREGIYG
jgi:hypothetical protein